jgi:hypothetical protein
MFCHDLLVLLLGTFLLGLGPPESYPAHLHNHRFDLRMFGKCFHLIALIWFCCLNLDLALGVLMRGRIRDGNEEECGEGD